MIETSKVGGHLGHGILLPQRGARVAGLRGNKVLDLHQRGVAQTIGQVDHGTPRLNNVRGTALRAKAALANTTAGENNLKKTVQPSKIKKICKKHSKSESLLPILR